MVPKYANLTNCNFYGPTQTSPAQPDLVTTRTSPAEPSPISRRNFQARPGPCKALTQTTTFTSKTVDMLTALE